MIDAEKGFTNRVNHPNRRRREGAHRRFFWRVRHRIGPGWDKLTEREIAKLLRQMSWRRPL